MKKKETITVVGAGLAGLAASLELERAGFPVQIFEAKAHIGGRVHSEIIEGFICDQGFQVLLNNYSEVKRLDLYKELEIQYFSPQSLCFYGEKKHLEPFYHPLYAPVSFIKHLCSSSRQADLRDYLSLAYLLCKAPLKGQSSKNHLEKRLSAHFYKSFIQSFFFWCISR